MSKSYGNAIYLSDSPEEIAAKVMQMITDPQRMRRSDPGNPDICNVFEFHKLYTDPEQVRQIDHDCRSAQIGCVECKKIMAKKLTEALAPIRDKRRYYESNPDLVQQIMTDGSAEARKIAIETMAQVKNAINIRY
jgi:tryptophanyl-tRNA synthetase